MDNEMKLRYPQDYRPSHKLDTVTASNYEVPKGWEKKYIVKQEQVATNNSGYRISAPTIQTYSATDWEQRRKDLLKMGYTLVVLYNPTEYLAKLEEQRAKAAEPVDTAALVAAEVAKALGGKTPEQIQAEAIEAYKKELGAAGGTPNPPAGPVKGAGDGDDKKAK